MSSRNIDFILIRSARKTIGLEIKYTGLVVRAGKFIPRWYIQALVNTKREWINKKIEVAKARKLILKQNPKIALSPVQTHDQITELTYLAKDIIPIRVEFYAEKIGVTYQKISFKNQKTIWGSCSSRGNLNFNINLVSLPIDILDYVVVHELCHLIEQNHSFRFWALVEKYCSDYKDCRKWLREHGNLTLG